MDSPLPPQEALGENAHPRMDSPWIPPGFPLDSPQIPHGFSPGFPPGIPPPKKAHNVVLLKR